MYSRLTLRPITVIRAVQWAAIAVTAWSSALPWGADAGIGKGPPAQFDRQLVGAALLLLVGAIAISMTGRKRAKPGRLALVVMGASSLSALALALSVRSTALAHHQEHVLLGGGWLWMAAGASMSLGAGASALALSLTRSEKPGPSKRNKARKNLRKKS